MNISGLLGDLQPLISQNFEISIKSKSIKSQKAIISNISLEMSKINFVLNFRP